MKRLLFVLTLCVPLAFNAVPTSASEAKSTRVNRYESIQSPSGHYVALSATGLGEVRPGFRMRMRILLVDIVQERVAPIWPMLHSEWAVTWAPGDVLVVFGLDTEGDAPRHKFISYDIAAGGIDAPRVSSESEKVLVRVAFEKKYAHKPEG